MGNAWRMSTPPEQMEAACDEPDHPTGEVMRLRGGRLPRRPPPRQAHRGFAALTCVDGPLVGQVITLEPGADVVLGRGAEASIRVPDESVSRRHARLWERKGRFFVQDLSSYGGTWMDGRRVVGPRGLVGPCRLHLGGFVSFRFDRHDKREQEVLAELHASCFRDPLTGAFNRRYLDDRLAAEVSFAGRHRKPLSVVMFDVDRFKLVNDRYGHPAGDAALRAITAQIRKMIRPEDVLVRYGGEEFCLVLRNLSAHNGEILADRIRRCVEALVIRSRDAILRVTISAGVAELTGATRTPPDLIRHADAALYQAKSQGRNQVVGTSAPGRSAAG